MDNKLKFETHIDEKATKANAIMGVIRRAFRHLDSSTFSKLYKALVRPHLEYAQSVWSPHQVKDIKKLEQIQRRATKQVGDLKNLSYKERLQRLKLPTLVYRRMRGDLIEVYKTLTGKYDPLVSDFLPLHNTVRGNRTRGHSLKLLKRDFRVDICRYSFSRRVVEPWNSLPEVVVSAPSLYSFENRLDRYWSKLDVKYDFEAALRQAVPFKPAPGKDQDLDTVASR